MVRVAVVGSGIAGLGAARDLARAGAEVDLFEADDRPGGHSNTVALSLGGRDVAVDTGFIIFNHRTYPRLVRLFHELAVPSHPTDMSFSCACAACGLEWGSAGLGTMFAQRKNLLRLEHHRLLAGIFRYFRAANGDLADEARLGDLSLGEWARARAIPDRVLRHFLVPIGAAIWSTPSEQMRDFPARSFLRFCQNHGLLGLTTAPRWHTVVGGSRVYVERLLRSAPIRLHLSTPVRSVRRAAEVLVETGGASPQLRRFDHLVLATHSDTALRLLADPSEDERRILGSIRYTDNETVLHGDLRHMPAARGAWSSWNHRSEDCRGAAGAVEVTYWMNRLQGIEGPPLLVTLNPRRPIDPAKIYARLRYAHPRFDGAAIAAQGELQRIQGPLRTYYAGAWQGYGFHEDGLRGGQEAAAALLRAAAERSQAVAVG